MKVFSGFILTVCLLATVSSAEDPPTEVWNRVYDQGNDDLPYDLVVNEGGHVFVGGEYNNGDNVDFRIVEYDSDGVVLWDPHYGDADDEKGRGITMDASGNIYITGYAEGDVLTVKYDETHSHQWTATYDGGHGDRGNDLTSDNSGCIYVAGYANNGTDDDYLIIKYNSNGDTMWTRISDASPPGQDFLDRAQGIAFNDGYIYVTGYYHVGLNSNIHTLIYDRYGNLIRGKVYDSGELDYGYGIAVDTDANIYVTGYSIIGTDRDIRTIKYDRMFDVMWNRTYDSGIGEWDEARDVALDAQGNVYVAGFSFNGNDQDFRIIKYDPAGYIVWDKIYDSGYNDFAEALTLDDESYIYVTGMSHNGSDYDFRTIKYQQATAVTEPSSPFSLSSEPPVTLEVIYDFSPNPLIRYLIPQGQQATLTFYSADGRKIASYPLDSSHSTFTWDTGNTPAGVYFACLVVGDQSKSCKVVIVR